MSVRSTFSLPLLSKELAERAARPRTYWMRILGGALLLLAFWSDNRSLFRAEIADPSSILGTGETMFRSLTEMLFVGIYLFVPAILCGAVTQEKERDSLSLLLLTNLRPWQIVLQKYIAGLVPALSLLLLALPLGAVSYAYGGFTTRELAFNLLILVLATLQIGALAIWCSCRFRTTVAAFFATYVFAGVLVLIPVISHGIDDQLPTHPLSPERQWWFLLHVPPAVLQGTKQHITSPPVSIVGPWVIIATTVSFLALAARDLRRRAFATSRPWLRLLFERVDRLMVHLNRRTGSIVLGRKSRALPLGAPVLWREVRARALARPEYLVRLLLVLEAPIIALAPMLVHPSFGRQIFGLSVLGAFVGIIAVLVLAATAANSVVNERVNQTLDVLLTTPLAAREIVRQKAHALRLLTWVLAIPVLTVFLIEAWAEETTPWTGYAETLGLRAWGETVITYVVGSICSVAIYLPLVAWLALWIGLICRTRLRALITTLIAIITWAVGPFFALDFFDVGQGRHDLTRWLLLCSPLTYPALNETGEMRDLSENAILPLLVNFTIYGAILWLLRWHCLRRADAYLRR